MAMTSGLRKIEGSATRCAAAWKVDRSPSRGMNCFGKLSREAGQSLVPEPPHMITGKIKPCSLDIALLTPCLDHSRQLKLALCSI